jgi:hypothetical protein
MLSPTPAKPASHIAVCRAFGSREIIQNAEKFK